jgi:type II secretory pathway component PulK
MAMRSTSDAGVAMLLALFALAIISSITLGLTSLGKQSVDKTRSITLRAQSAAMTEGAIYSTFPILVSEDRDEILKKQQGHIKQSISGKNITVHVSDACGRWDLNHGRLDVLDALLNKFNIRKRKAFTKELIKIRNTGNGFQHINQTRALSGLEKKAPSKFIDELTIYCQTQQVDPRYSSSTMKELLMSLPRSASAPGPGRVFRMESSNTLGPGSNISINSYIRITNNPSQPIKILAWQSTY